MPRCSPMAVVMMYILFVHCFRVIDATVLLDASCNDVHFCLYIFSGYRCHGAPRGLQKSHGKGTTSNNGQTLQILDQIGPVGRFGEKSNVVFNKTAADVT